MFRGNIIKEINVEIIQIIIEMIREMIKIKKAYLKDSLPYSTYAQIIRVTTYILKF